MSRNLPMQPSGESGTDLTPHVQPPQPQPSYVEYAPDAGDPGGFDWRRYFSALGRHKWLLLGATALGVLAGVFLMRRALPMYTATATMSIQTQGPGDEAGGPITASQRMSPQLWKELLLTSTVLEPVVREQRLNAGAWRLEDGPALDGLSLREEYVPGAYQVEVSEDGTRFTFSVVEGPVLQEGRVGEPIGAGHGIVWQPDATILTPGRIIPFNVIPTPGAVSALASQLRPQLRESGGFMTISADRPTGDAAAQLVNAVGERFEKVAADYKRLRLEELTAILREQLDSASQNLAEAENALAAFQSRNIAAPIQQTQGETDARGRFLRMSLDAERLRQAQGVLIDAVADGRADGADAIALESLPEIESASDLTSALNQLTTAKSELRTLSQNYTSLHELVEKQQALVDTLETITIPRLATTLANQLDREIAILRTAIDTTSTVLQTIPARTMQEFQLQRARDVANTMYLNVRQKFEAARLAAVSSLPDVRLHDRAVTPDQPSTDMRGVLLLLGSLGGLGFGLLGIMVLDRGDKRVRFPDQVTSDLGLPILGAAPQVSRRNGSLKPDQAAAVIEAFRGIRLNLHYAHGVGGPMALAISSPAPGDGKSFVTSNLALAFAEQGYNTLIVDADVRRGTLHRLLDGSRKPGLTDYLAGTAERVDVIQPTKYPYLSLMSCGTRMDTGPAMLSSPRMKQLIQEVQQDFPVVLIDSAPLAAGADPLVLGTLTGNLVLVLRTGATDRHLAEAKLGVIDRLPIRMLGAVLNAVPPGGVYNYYYRAYAYLPEYDYGVEAESAADSMLGRALPQASANGDSERA